MTPVYICTIRPGFYTFQLFELGKTKAWCLVMGVRRVIGERGKLWTVSTIAGDYPAVAVSAGLQSVLVELAFTGAILLTQTDKQTSSRDIQLYWKVDMVSQYWRVKDL